jgi:hypothetical protein
MELTGQKIKSGELKTCSRCIYDETIPAINFDSEGVCNYCKMIDGLQDEYKTATPEGEKKFLELVEQIKKDGKGKKYDCAIGVSGGTDSSYIIYKAVKEWGLRPIAVHYDNTWNSAIATENIRKVLGKLNVDLYTYVVDNKESDDMFRSFFLAGVPELDGPTDIAAPEVMYRACAKFKVKYVIEGHSFRTEGVSPLGNMYIDGKYIQEVHKKYGKVKMKTFPNMPLFTFLKWLIIYRIKKIRPLWYISYSLPLSLAPTLLISFSSILFILLKFFANESIINLSFSEIIFFLSVSVKNIFLFIIFKFIYKYNKIKKT